ncbi:MAG: hypothetical protein ACTSYD_01145 [Candidatus Heimdallarchaeaceae archaeon]
MEIEREQAETVKNILDFYQQAESETCNLGDKKCSSGIVYECNSSGIYILKKQCSLGCDGNNCKSAKCVPYSKRCDGDYLKICNPNGSDWSNNKIKCSNGCKDGSCIQTSKQKEEELRLQNQLQQFREADSKSMDEYENYVKQKASDANNKTKICFPGSAVACEGNKRLICNSSGTGLTSGGTCVCGCSHGICQKCAVIEKTEDEKRDDMISKILEFKKADYESYKQYQEAIGDTGDCTPGHTTCATIGTVSFLYKCTEDRVLKAESTCKNGCDGNLCASYKCIPYETRCADRDNVERCTEDGMAWVPDDTCTVGCNMETGKCYPNTASLDLASVPTCSSTTDCPDGWFCNGDIVPGQTWGSLNRYCTKGTTDLTDDLSLLNEEGERACQINRWSPECLEHKTDKGISTANDFIEYQRAWQKACASNPQGEECQVYQDAQKMAMFTSNILASAPFMLAGIPSPIALGSTAYSWANYASECSSVTDPQQRQMCDTALTNSILSTASLGVGTAGMINPAIYGSSSFQAVNLSLSGTNLSYGLYNTIVQGQGGSNTDFALALINNVFDIYDFSVDLRSLSNFNNSIKINKIYDQIYAEEQVKNTKLAKFITGKNPTDPNFKETIMNDAKIVRSKYGLPPQEMLEDNPTEYLRRIEELAASENITIKSGGSFFKDNPFATGVFIRDSETGSQQSLIMVNDTRWSNTASDTVYYKQYKDTLVSYIDTLQHEVIHGQQYNKYPAMPIEIMEYEAYLGSTNSELFENMSPEKIVNDFFGYFGVKGSVEYFYKSKGETPSW